MDEIKEEVASQVPQSSQVSGVKKMLAKCKCGNRQHIIAGVVILALIIAAGVYFYKTKKTDVGLEGAKTKVADFVNGNLLPPGMKAEVKEAVKESDLYKVTIMVGEQEVATYLTLDGKKFFPEGMDTTVEKKEVAQAEPDKEIPKTDKPVVDLYVMSFCPFGNKSEDTMKPVYDLLKNKVDFNFHYIVSSNGDEIQSLHGPKEVEQNEREVCVLKNYGKDKWFGFVTYVNKNCGSDGACWEAGAKAWGINAAKITACVKTEGVSLMKENEKVSGEAGAQGSPTMAINGVTNKTVYQYGNSEGYKQVICSAFNTAPKECDKVLASAAATDSTAPASCDTAPAAN